ncbi:MAG: flagellar assembly protein FliW [Eubacterium sp.]|nr:flagellar assembly protein FliW [Eubacterium sp.]
MKADTRLFGEIDIKDDKIIKLKEGIIGFPDLQNFTLIHDEEKEGKGSIKWLQSMDDPAFALPVMNPLDVKPDYQLTVNEEGLEPLGTMTEENTFILVTITVPQNIEEMSVNLKAPFIINADNLQGVQMIVEDDYPVKYKIYEILNKKKAGE